jgi:hypothetical protein
VLVKTPKALSNKLNKILNEAWLDQLWERWQDEQRYEDPKDYGKVFAQNTGLEVTRVKRRPLAFVVRSADFPEALYEVQCARRCNRWRRLS